MHFTLFSFCRFTDSIFRLISLLDAAYGVSCSIILLICFKDVVTDLKIPSLGNYATIHQAACELENNSRQPLKAVKDTLPHIIKHRLVFFLSFGFGSRLVGFMDCLIHLLEDTLLENVLVIHSHAETLEFTSCRGGRCCLDTLSVDLQQGSRPLCAYATDKKNNIQVKLMMWRTSLLFSRDANVPSLTAGSLIRSSVGRKQCRSLRALTASG